MASSKIKLQQLDLSDVNLIYYAMIEKGLIIPDLTHLGNIQIAPEYSEVIQEEIDKPKPFVVLDFDDSIIIEVNSIEEGVEEFLKIHPNFEKDAAKVFVYSNPKNI